MADQLSGIAIIICIAFGVLTFLLLFIFANRQIKRFSLKSRSGPHVPTASDSTKAMQQEIDRRFDAVKGISYQPKLLNKEDENIFDETDHSNVSPLHLYRMKALDSINVLESSIVSSDSHVGVSFCKDLRLCLVRLFQKGSLRQIEISDVHRFADLYDSARHEPGEFDFQSYVQFIQLQNQILQSISSRNSNASTHKVNSSGNRHFGTSSASVETLKNLSNGKLSTNLTPPIVDDEEEQEQDGSTENKRTYETSV